MDFQDYYKILGVTRDADEKTIKKAYRNLARKYHPDHNPEDESAEAQFKRVNEAYEVLGNVENRQKYNELGRDYKRYQQQGGAGGGYGGMDFEGMFGRGAQGGGYGRGGNPDLSDFFSSFFGGQDGRTAQPLRRDVEQPVTITLEEAYAGASRVLVSEEGDRFTVKIPAGVDEGSRIRFRGKGGRGADLYLVISVAKHAIYKRDGNNLSVNFDVEFLTAVLGGKAEVQTLKGAGKLTIPAGTQGGSTFRLRGRGMPSLKRKGEFGDLLAKARVRVPTTLSDEERVLYEKLVALNK